MTTNTGEPAKASNTAKKWLSLNGQALANQESSRLSDPAKLLETI